MAVARHRCRDARGACFHVGLEAPSALAVALCIEHAVLPKDRSRTPSAGETSWDMFGLPRAVLVDNGPEFHGEALTRGCSEYGIKLLHRPVARPRFGAHIERLIGLSWAASTCFRAVPMPVD